MPRAVTAATLSFAMLGLCAGAAMAWADGAVYKWVDDQGVVHYGDSIPPQYAQKESTQLNAEGVAIGHRAGARTPAEQAADAAAAEAAMQQKQHDTFLLATYTSVKDIEQLRDERLSQVRGQRAAAEQYVASLGERLAALQARPRTSTLQHASRSTSHARRSGRADGAYD